MRKIHDLKKKLIFKFPFVGKENELSQLAHSMGKVDLRYFINHDNMVTGDPKENFDSRKTKIKDDNFKSLYDQLVQEWAQSEALDHYDGAIIESPKYTRNRKLRKSRMQFLMEPENIEDDDLEELGNLTLENQESQKNQGPQTYKFEQLAELVADKTQDLEFGDLNSDKSEENDEVSNNGQLQDLALGRRMSQMDRSVGGLAPGIKVR